MWCYIGFRLKIVNHPILKKYDSVITEKTICTVLDPYSLVKIFPRTLHYNKAVGTIWRDLSKPLQRRQGPDPDPLWLLVRTPSALVNELTSTWEHSLLLFMSLYFFDVMFFIPKYIRLLNFYGSTLVGCWSLVV